MTTVISTSNGDGQRMETSLASLRQDILEGSQEAARAAKIDPLPPQDLEILAEIFIYPNRIASVKPGAEVVTTDDAADQFFIDSGNGGPSLPMSPLMCVLGFERLISSDTLSLGLVDYSCRPMKPIIEHICSEYYCASQQTSAPLFYGFQPNLGQYFQPVGPFPDHFSLMKSGKIKEAVAAQEEAAKALVEDMLFVAGRLYEVGLEGINLDTCGSYGDPDLLAALEGCEQIKAVYPDLPVEMGFAGETIIGMNGKMTYKGLRLAGAPPHRQVELAAKAGASIVGLAINTNTSKSTPWNLSRSATYIKAASQASTIPVHANIGMGVCGVPMFILPSLETLTRCSKAMVEVGQADGL